MFVILSETKNPMNSRGSFAIAQDDKPKKQSFPDLIGESTSGSPLTACGDDKLKNDQSLYF